MAMVDKEKLAQFISSEKKAAHKKGFVKGLVVGLFIPVLLISTIIIVALFSRRALEEKIGEYVMSSVMTQVFTAFPDAYFTLNRERIIKVLDDFTNAASKHQISNSEFRKIGRRFLQAMQDRQLSYAELDDILALMKEAAHN